LEKIATENEKFERKEKEKSLFEKNPSSTSSPAK
jgi:hypothetical protein